MPKSTAPSVDAEDVFTLSQARRVAVMLGVDPLTLSAGSAVPRGWHFALLAGETPRRSLRSDGFPGLGIPMPQLDRPRLLLAQRSTRFEGDLTVGAPLKRHSTIGSIVEKSGRNGPLSIVKMEHRLSRDDGHGSVVESQTYYLAGLPAPGVTTAEPAGRAVPTIETEAARTVVTPDDLMLFQYSALGFNTHRIHFDRDYATRVEGHPDLVVNGGLATLLATEFLRTGLGKTVNSVSSHHKAPLHVNRPMTILVAEPSTAGTKVLLLDGEGIVAAELVMTFDDL